MPSSVYRNRWAAEKSMVQHAVRRSLWAATKRSIPPTPYDLEIDLDNPISHWKLGASTTEAIDRKNVRNLPATNGPIATTAGLTTNNSDDLANTFESTQRFGGAVGGGLGAPWNTSVWSAEAWFKPLASVVNKQIIDQGARALGIGAGNRPSANSADSGGTGRTATAVQAMVVGGVYHLVAVADGTDVILYVNGIEAARTACTGSFPVLSTTPEINNTAFGIQGVIDEVAWYGTALSPARVLAHYNAGKAPAKSLPLPPRQRRYPPRWLLAPARPRIWVSKPLSRYRWVGSSPPVRTPYDLVIDVDNPVSHWKLGNSTTEAFDRMRFAHLPALNGPINTSAGIVANNDNNLANVFVSASNQRFDFTDNGIPYQNPIFSLEAWVKPTAAVLSNDILFRGGSQHNLSVLNLKPRVFFVDTLSSTKAVAGPSNLIANTIYHLVGTYDGSTLILYVNGIEANRLATIATPDSGSSSPRIGRGGGTAWDGVIDEVAWYNYALSPARVLAHYQAGAPGDIIAPVISVDSVDATRISRVAGKDVTNVNFTANEAFVEYEVRRVSSAADNRAMGSQVETATVSSRTSHSIQLTDDEIIAAAAIEGTNLFKVFVRDAAGNWST